MVDDMSWAFGQAGENGTADRDKVCRMWNDHIAGTGPSTSIQDKNGRRELQPLR